MYYGEGGKGRGEEEVRWRPPPLPPSLICDARESKLGLWTCFDDFDRSYWLAGLEFEKEADRGADRWIDELGWTNEWMESNELNC